MKNLKNIFHVLLLSVVIAGGIQLLSGDSLSKINPQSLTAQAIQGSEIFTTTEVIKNTCAGTREVDQPIEPYTQWLKKGDQDGYPSVGYPHRQGSILINEVTKLQNDLVRVFAKNIKVTGNFNEETSIALGEVQKQYAREILDVWSPVYGEDHVTNNFYKSTRIFFNNYIYGVLEEQFIEDVGTQYTPTLNENPWIYKNSKKMIIEYEYPCSRRKILSRRPPKKAPVKVNEEKIIEKDAVLIPRLKLSLSQNEFDYTTTLSRSSIRTGKFAQRFRFTKIAHAFGIVWPYILVAEDESYSLGDTTIVSREWEMIAIDSSGGYDGAPENDGHNLSPGGGSDLQLFNKNSSITAFYALGNPLNSKNGHEFLVKLTITDDQGNQASTQGYFSVIAEGGLSTEGNNVLVQFAYPSISTQRNGSSLIIDADDSLVFEHYERLIYTVEDPEDEEISSKKPENISARKDLESIWQNLPVGGSSIYSYQKKDFGLGKVSIQPLIKNHERNNVLTPPSHELYSEFYYQFK